MKSIKKFVLHCIAIYLLLFFILIILLGWHPGSDFVGGTFIYYGFVILSSVLLHLFQEKN